MTVPAYLQPGDKIAVLAPARPVAEADLQRAVELIAGKGFVPVLGKHVREVYHQFAGTDAQRAADFQEALDDPQIKAIVAVRGGYGCLRIVDRLDLARFAQIPKWIVGYSDMTIIQAHVMRQTNVCTLHATMPLNFFKSDRATQSMFDALTGKNLHYTFDAKGSYRATDIKAPVTGGNLSLVYGLQGSVSDLQTDGKILFLEDLDEYLYHIDRMMHALKRAGKLSRLKALLIGGFTGMKDNAVPFGFDAREIILDVVKEFNYPVFFNFPAGHQDLNCAIKFGMEASIDVVGDKAEFRQAGG